MPTPNNSLPRQTFTKGERLCSKKRIEQLFSAGNRSLSAYPLRAVYMQEQREGMPCELLISVSKRHHRHAVDRNRLKRLVREAYRRNKHTLYEALQGRKMSLALLWVSNDLAPYSLVEHKVRNLLQRICEELSTQHNEETAQ